MNGYAGGFIAIGILIAILFVIYFVTGQPLGSKIIQSNPPVAGATEPNTAKFMFFYTSWCPHSVTASKTWKSFKQMMQNSPKKYGGMNIQFEDINAESNVGKTALYNVKEYPTFKLETSRTVYEMVGNPHDVSVFRNFLIKSLGREN